jgi:hypothetical protein
MKVEEVLLRACSGKTMNYVVAHSEKQRFIGESPA